jgi:predicted AAA+ superfamily ATPase
MRAACASLGQVEHQAQWAETTGLSTSTVSRWTDLLEMAWQLRRLPAYSVNRTSRLTKKPKLYWTDTAMAMHLAGLAEPTGHHLENLVLADLDAWCGSKSQRPVVHHWRTVARQEVDFVIELPSGRVLPVEIKATRTPGFGDTAGLRAFLGEYGDLALGGLLLHGGPATIRMAPDILAVPWWQVV